MQVVELNRQLDQFSTQSNLMLPYLEQDAMKGITDVVDVTLATLKQESVESKIAEADLWAEIVTNNKDPEG